MFSEFRPFFGLDKRALEWRPRDGHTDRALQAASMHHIITSAENKRVRNPISDPRTPDLFWSRPQQVPLCPLKQQLPGAEPEDAKMQICGEGPSQVTFPSEL